MAAPQRGHLHSPPSPPPPPPPPSRAPRQVPHRERILDVHKERSPTLLWSRRNVTHLPFPPPRENSVPSGPRAPPSPPPPPWPRSTHHARIPVSPARFPLLDSAASYGGNQAAFRAARCSRRQPGDCPNHPHKDPRQCRQWSIKTSWPQPASLVLPSLWLRRQPTHPTHLPPPPPLVRGYNPGPAPPTSASGASGWHGGTQPLYIVQAWRTRRHFRCTSRSQLPTELTHRERAPLRPLVR